MQERVNRVFSLYLGVSAFWSFTSFMLHLNAFPQQAILWNEILVVALTWTPLAYYHFARAYTNQPAGIVLYAGYSLLLAFAVLCLNGYIVKSAYVVNGVLYHDLGASLYIIGTACLAFAGAVIFLLIQRYRSSLDPIERNRTMYLIAGWIMLALFAYTNLVPAVAGLPLDHLGNLANALIIAYAISRFRLLNISFVVRRGLAYFLVSLCLIGIYIGSIFLGQELFPTQPTYNIVLSATVVVLLLALLTRPLRYIIQEQIDRLFYRETYHHREALLSFSSKMGNILNLDELASETLPMVSKALRMTQAKLLFQDIDSGDFATQFTYPKAEEGLNDEFRFNVDNPIVAWLSKEGKPLDLRQIDSIPQLKGLWKAEREQLATSSLRLLCPIKSRGRLIGILVLGKRQTDSHYSHGDIELIMSMTSQAGIGSPIFTIYQFFRTKTLIDGGLRTTDTVVAQKSLGGPGNKLFIHVTRFQTGDGSDIEFKNFSLFPQKAYSTVNIRYDPKNPKHAKIDSWGNLWGFTLVYGLVGGIIYYRGLPRLLEPSHWRHRLHQGSPLSSYDTITSSGSEGKP